MTHSGKSSAALRVRSLAELTDPGLSNPASERDSSHENIRSNVVRGFPKLVQQQPAPPAETALPQLEDLAAELEAALMGDLQKVASLWDEPDAAAAATESAALPAPELALPELALPELALPALMSPEQVAANEAARDPMALDQAELDPTLASELPPAELTKDDLPQQDRLAVELLLARGRQPSAAPKPAARAPAAVELEDRLAGELAHRLSIAVDELRIADGEQPTLDADRSLNAGGSRGLSTLNKQLLAVVALLAVVGGGALLTIRSVTASGDAAVVGELDGAATAGIVKAEPPAPLPAPAAKQSYDRAAEDQSLPESPQLRGADMINQATPLNQAPTAQASVDPVPGSAPTLGAAMLPGSAVSTQPVTPSVRAAYAAPAEVTKPTAVETASVTDPAPSADDAGVAAEPDAGAPKPAAVAPSKAVAAGSPAPGLARVTSAVKLRGNPDNGAPTVGLLKAGEQVQVVQCKGWCEVVVDGKRGFVFKKFLASING